MCRGTVKTLHPDPSKCANVSFPSFEFNATEKEERKRVPRYSFVV